MKEVIADISLYPFDKDYEGPIGDLITRLKRYEGLEVRPAETSTVLRGPYDVVFRALESECRYVLDGQVKAVFVIKVMNLV